MALSELKAQIEKMEQTAQITKPAIARKPGALVLPPFQDKQRESTSEDSMEAMIEARARRLAEEMIRTKKLEEDAIEARKAAAMEPVPPGEEMNWDDCHDPEARAILIAKSCSVRDNRENEALRAYQFQYASRRIKEYAKIPSRFYTPRVLSVFEASMLTFASGRHLPGNAYIMDGGFVDLPVGSYLPETGKLLVKKGRMLFSKLPLEMRTRDFCLQMLQSCFAFLWEVPVVHRDKDLCITALSNEMGTIHDVPKSLRTSPEFVNACMQQKIVF